MYPLDQCITGDHQLLIVTGIKERSIITNTQCDTALTGKPGKVVGDQFKLTRLMGLLISQGFVLSCYFGFRASFEALTA
jgi:hypothetical protein